MIFRTRRVITGALFCHLLLAPPLLTSQLLAPAVAQSYAYLQSQTPGTVPQSTEFSSYLAPEQGEQVVIEAKVQEKEGPVFRLRGNVRIEYRDLVLRADEVTYNQDTGQVTASGHLTLDGGSHDEHVEATSGEYNVKTQTGRFHDVVASTGVRFRGRNVTLTSPNPFIFTGKLVEKTSPTRYVLYNGYVTSCQLPSPKWTFNAGKVIVDIDGSAQIYNSTFRIKNVPIFYFPYASHPVEVGRHTGFLVPTFGASSRKGTTIGDSFYWAINRSMDLTLGGEYYSSRGFAQTGEFRSKPSDNSYLNVNYYGVLDRGFGPNKVDQGGADAKLDGEAIFPAGIRGVASIEYLSSFIFRLAFTENFSQAVNSEVRSLAFLSKDIHNFFLNTSAARYQNFESATRGDLITILHVPNFNFSTVDRQFLNTPVYWGFDAGIDGLSRREPAFKTDDLVGRFDIHPRASIPLFFHGWTFRPEMGLRNTYYTQRKVGPGIGVPIDDALNRRAVEASIELRPPTLGRIFEKPLWGRQWKHTIEPRIIYHVVNGVANFDNVIRFDSNDILSDTSELEFGLVQRLFLKPTNPRPCDELKGDEVCTTGPREFITWEVAQRYYFDPQFGGAVVSGKRNMLATTADLTGFAFLTEPRRFSPVVSRLRVRATSRLDGSWELDYDTKKGRINASTVIADYHLRDFFLGASHAFMHTPGEIFVSNPIPAPEKFDQFRLLLGYGGLSKRGLSSAVSIGFDSGKGFLQYGSWQNSYNWDCCGVSMEYRRFALGTVRNENQFRFAFTLANIGTFGNLKRSASLF